MSLINKIKQTVKLEEKLASYNGDDKVISSHELQEILDKKEENLERISSGFEQYDKVCKGFETGELIVVTGYTGNGKSSICQTLTSNFAKDKNYTLWFSYEMPPRQFLRKFNGLPLFYIPKEIKGSAIDWIKEKIIEAKLKYGIKIVMIDHLHFLIDMIKMNHPSLEIGTIVRQLKTLCIKHNIVIFLVSHTTKPKGSALPSLDSLRDCLPSDQLIYKEDGSRIKVGSIKKGDRILSRKGINKLQTDYITEIWKTGKKKIFRLITKTGRKIECSDGHKFYALTYKQAKKFGPRQGCGIAGWKKLKELVIGQKIAVIKNYPDTNIENITVEQAKLLGWIIGDGHITKSYHTEITLSSFEETEYLKKLAKDSFGIEIKITPYKDKNAYRAYLSNKGKRNKLREFLKNNKFNPVGINKYIPEKIFKQSKRIIGAFLSGLFHADGSIGKNGNGEYGKSFIISYHTISERLARDTQHLLLRLGIVGFLRKQSLGSKSGYKTKNEFIWNINIRGYDIIRFKIWINFLCEKQKKFTKLIKNWSSKVRKKEKEIYFESIKSIQFIEEKETYDISVRGHHASLKNNSFCVNDFITHNSSFTTQESDCTLAIHRIKLPGGRYGPDSWLIILKHRREGVMGRKIKLTYQDNQFKEISFEQEEERSVQEEAFYDPFK